MQLDLLPKPAGLTRAEARRNAMRAAETRRDLGITRAAAGADFDMPGWISEAVEALREFARTQVGVWTIEQARAVIGDKVPVPYELRAWGKATRLGYIQSEHRVYISTACSNGTAKPGWKRGANA